MIDYAASGLTQTTFFELLDDRKRALGSLEGVRAMTRERSIYTSPRTSAALELTPQSDIDWGKRRVRALVCRTIAIRWHRYQRGGFPPACWRGRCRRSLLAALQCLH